LRNLSRLPSSSALECGDPSERENHYCQHGLTYIGQRALTNARQVTDDGEIDA
jgi:hypothetical protein